MRLRFGRMARAPNKSTPNQIRKSDLKFKLEISKFGILLCSRVPEGAAPTVRPLSARDDRKASFCGG